MEACGLTWKRTRVTRTEPVWGRCGGRNSTPPPAPAKALVPHRGTVGRKQTKAVRDPAKKSTGRTGRAGPGRAGPSRAGPSRSEPSPSRLGNPRPEGLNLVPCAARYDLGVESARRGLTRIWRILENCYHPESYMDVQDLVDGRTDGRRIEWRPRPIPWTPWPRRIVMGLERTLPTRVSGWTFSVCGRTDFKRREDSQKSTILSRTAAVFELPIRSGRNTPHPHLKPPLPPPQPPAPPSSPTLGAVVGHGGMLAGWWLVGGGVVEETRKQTTVARG
ncbi:uncharacterized protein LOC116662557 isoform X2 [Camelus ferus]|uniref:Uncharacterized protein LOC116662557 isoform X2 n=1 Tax=Camelus ferus TaxID=419612 RepID=A0A8B8SQZ6_CAMFR|nr:uncharacterized protein LOC116662557 isoform X2 [Camelus ferus]